MSHTSDEAPARPNDSPWFWLLLFALVGLAALAVIGPKHVRRQQRLVRMQQAREHVAAGQRGPQAQAAAEPADGEVSLLPLMAFFGLLLVVASCGLLVIRRRGRHGPTFAEKHPP